MFRQRVHRLTVYTLFEDTSHIGITRYNEDEPSEALTASIPATARSCTSGVDSSGIARWDVFMGDQTAVPGYDSEHRLILRENPFCTVRLSGHRSYDVSIHTTDDDKAEGDETFAIVVGGSSGVATLDTAAVILKDNEPPPGQPGKPTATLSTGVIEITWSPVDTATEYKVRYSTNAGGNWTGRHPTSNTSESFDSTGAGVYVFQVRGVNLGGYGAPAEVKATPVHSPPEFDDGETTSREVAENTGAGIDIGDPVSATDDDGDTLTYELSGAGASNFAVDGAGQISVAAGASLDHETEPSYSVRVTVSDGNGGTDTITVAIIVTDLDEPPGKPAPPQSRRRTPTDTTA